MNLIDQLTFYGSYHHNKGNQAVHIIFVPLILWSAWIFLALIPWQTALPYSFTKLLPTFIAQHLVINAGFVAFITYALYYIALSPVEGMLYFPLLFLLYISSNMFLEAYGSKAWLYAAVAHVLSWYMQVQVGHLTLEGRKPALLDSFFQSIVLAPFFVFFELLFWLGWRPSLQRELNGGIARRIKFMDAKI